MSSHHPTVPEMLDDLDERIRVEEARLEKASDPNRVEHYRAEIRMLRAIQTQIAGPETYLTESGRP